jgi:hypothetical protein
MRLLRGVGKFLTFMGTDKEKRKIIELEKREDGEYYVKEKN